MKKIFNILSVSLFLITIFFSSCKKEEIIPTIEKNIDNSIKYKALLYFMFYTGVRRSEVVKLKRKDIDLNNKRVTIYATKTKRERIIPLTQRCVNILNSYFASEPEIKSAFNVTVSDVNYFFSCMKPLFKDFNFHPHLFRHSLGRHLTKQGIPDSRIAEMLGHSDLNSTKIYTQLRNEEFENQIRNALETSPTVPKTLNVGGEEVPLDLIKKLLDLYKKGELK